MKLTTLSLLLAVEVSTASNLSNLMSAAPLAANLLTSGQLAANEMSGSGIDKYTDFPGVNNAETSQQRLFEAEENVEEFAEGRLFTRKNEVDLASVYDFLTNDSTVIGFLFVVIFEFITKSVGWFILSEVWNLGKGSPLSLMDLNAKELIVFLTDPTAAATNIAITTGYYILNVLTFLVMASFGTVGEEEETIKKKTDVDPVNTYDAIDGKLSFQGMAITSLVNVVLAFGFALFWIFMSYFPAASERKQEQTARSSQNLDSENELINSEQTLYNSIEYYDSL